jgi:hypothetical protein
MSVGRSWAEVLDGRKLRGRRARPIANRPQVANLPHVLSMTWTELFGEIVGAPRLDTRVYMQNGVLSRSFQKFTNVFRPRGEAPT